MSKIFVIGATGNVGGKLVPLLAQRGETVKAATRTPKNYEAPSTHVEPTRFDYDDPETFETALTDVDRIFMLAMPADPLAYERLTPFIDAAKTANVQHILMMTAMGIEHTDEQPLRKIEKYIEASGVSYTFIRPNWFMDNFSTGFIQPMIAESNRFFLPVDEAKTSFIATQDIAAVAAVILTEPGHQGKAYTLTGSHPLTYSEVAQILSDVVGYTIEYVPITDTAMRQSMSEAGFSEEEHLDYFSGMFGAVRTGFTAPVTFTVEQILEQKPITLKNFAIVNAHFWR